MAKSSHVRSRLISALEQLHRPVMARQFPRLAGKIHGLEMSFSQLVAIAVVGDKGNCTIRELAEKVDLTHNATSRMVDRLVTAELMTRTENSHDRRQKRIALTEKGAAFMPDVRAASIEIYEELLGDVPEDIASKLLASLEEMNEFIPSTKS